MFLLVIFVVNIFSLPISEANSTLNATIVIKFPTDCTTPNRDGGYCVSIDECHVLRELKNVREHSEFIKESNCTPSNARSKTIKVCCGKYDNFLNKEDQIPPLNSQSTQVEDEVNDDPFPKECGKQVSFPSRIFGGREAVLGEFPWLVRLRHKATNGLNTYGCVGFLIAPKYVLTAAHCVLNKQLFPLGPISHVQLGEHNTLQAIDCEKQGEVVVCADPPQLIRNGHPIVHPEYDNTSRSQHHDIAIIPLKYPVNATNYVRPICLAKQPTEETEMWLSGWGKTEYDPRSAIKLKVSVKYTNANYCREKYKTTNVEIKSSQICAGGEENKDSCSGDSGGPLMVQSGSGPWYAEGVVSFGLGCGLEFWPGVYTSIPYYHSWIEKTVRKHYKHNLEKARQSFDPK